MKNIREFAIETKKNRIAFLPGDLLKGELYICLDEPINIKSLKILLYGEGGGDWLLQADRLAFKKVAEKKRVIVDIGLLVFGFANEDGGNRTETHEKGRFVYDFEFNLPENLPRTFKSPPDKDLGYAKYFLKAVLSRPKKYDKVKKFSIVINEVIAPDRPELAFQPGSYEEKNVRTAFMPSGSLTLESYLNRSQYTQGEAILINAVAQNKSTKIMKEVYAKLIRRIRCKSRFGTNTYTIDTASLHDSRLQPRGSIEWKNKSMNVPAVGPTVMGNEDIRVDYIVRVGMFEELGSEIHLDLPVIIGTVGKSESSEDESSDVYNREKNRYGLQLIKAGEREKFRKALEDKVNSNNSYGQQSELKLNPSDINVNVEQSETQDDSKLESDRPKSARGFHEEMSKSSAGRETNGIVEDEMIATEEKVVEGSLQEVNYLSNLGRSQSACDYRSKEENSNLKSGLRRSINRNASKKQAVKKSQSTGSLTDNRHSTDNRHLSNGTSRERSGSANSKKGFQKLQSRESASANSLSNTNGNLKSILKKSGSQKSLSNGSLARSRELVIEEKRSTVKRNSNDNNVNSNYWKEILDSEGEVFATPPQERKEVTKRKLKDETPIIPRKQQVENYVIDEEEYFKALDNQDTEMSKEESNQDTEMSREDESRKIHETQQLKAELLKDGRLPISEQENNNETNEKNEERTETASFDSKILGFIGRLFGKGKPEEQPEKNKNAAMKDESDVDKNIYAGETNGCSNGRVQSNSSYKDNEVDEDVVIMAQDRDVYADEDENVYLEKLDGEEHHDRLIADSKDSQQVYDRHGQLTSDSKDSQQVYDRHGQLTSDSKDSQQVYDRHGQLTSDSKDSQQVYDRQGQLTSDSKDSQQVYDRHGQLIKKSKDSQQVYDRHSQQTSDSKDSQQVYDRHGQQTSDSKDSQQVYDRHGQLVAKSKDSQQVYDRHGQLITKSKDSQQVYDRHGQLTSDSKDSQQVYDRHGQLVAKSKDSQQVYDRHGQLITKSKDSQQVYDRHSQQTSDSKDSQQVYDRHGQLITKSKDSQQVYDRHSQQTSDSKDSQQVYDRHGQLITKSKDSQQVYDRHSQQTSDSKDSQQVYDRHGQLITKSKDSQQMYDRHGQLTSDSKDSHQVYDRHGQLITKSKDSQQVYDRHGQLTSDSKDSQQVYDRHGQLTSDSKDSNQVYDRHGQLITNSKDSQQMYDRHGQLTSDFKDSQQVYDRHGKLISKSKDSQQMYDRHGQLIAKSKDSQQVYDRHGQLISDSKDSNQVYDRHGQLIAKSKDSQQVYDRHGQLTSDSKDSNQVYDRHGQLITNSKDSQQMYDRHGQLTSDSKDSQQVYDRHGQLTSDSKDSHQVYDRHGQLIAKSKGIQQVYDRQGQLIADSKDQNQLIADSKDSQQVCDRHGQLIAKSKGIQQVYDRQGQLIADSKDQSQLIADSKDSNQVYDRHGQLIAKSKDSQQVYDRHGQLTSDSKDSQQVYDRHGQLIAKSKDSNQVYDRHGQLTSDSKDSHQVYDRHSQLTSDSKDSQQVYDRHGQLIAKSKDSQQVYDRHGQLITKSKDSQQVYDRHGQLTSDSKDSQQVYDRHGQLTSDSKDSQQVYDRHGQLVAKSKDSQQVYDRHSQLTSDSKDSQQVYDRHGQLIAKSKDSQQVYDRHGQLIADFKDSQQVYDRHGQLITKSKDSQQVYDRHGQLTSDSKDSQQVYDRHGQLTSDSKDSQQVYDRHGQLIAKSKDSQQVYDRHSQLTSDSKDSQQVYDRHGQLIAKSKNSQQVYDRHGQLIADFKDSQQVYDRHGQLITKSKDSQQVYDRHGQLTSDSKDSQQVYDRHGQLTSDSKDSQQVYDRHGQLITKSKNKIGKKSKSNESIYGFKGYAMKELRKPLYEKHNHSLNENSDRHDRFVANTSANIKHNEHSGSEYKKSKLKSHKMAAYIGTKNQKQNLTFDKNIEMVNNRRIKSCMKKNLTSSKPVIKRLSSKQTQEKENTFKGQKLREKQFPQYDQNGRRLTPYKSKRQLSKEITRSQPEEKHSSLYRRQTAIDFLGNRRKVKNKSSNDVNKSTIANTPHADIQVAATRISEKSRQKINAAEMAAGRTLKIPKVNTVTISKPIVKTKEKNIKNVIKGINIPHGKSKKLRRSVSVESQPVANLRHLINKELSRSQPDYRTAVRREMDEDLLKTGKHNHSFWNRKESVQKSTEAKRKKRDEVLCTSWTHVGDILHRDDELNQESEKIEIHNKMTKTLRPWNNASSTGSTSIKIPTLGVVTNKVRSCSKGRETKSEESAGKSNKLTTKPDSTTKLLNEQTTFNKPLYESSDHKAEHILDNLNEYEKTNASLSFDNDSLKDKDFKTSFNSFYGNTTSLYTVNPSSFGTHVKEDVVVNWHQSTCTYGYTKTKKDWHKPYCREKMAGKLSEREFGNEIKRPANEWHQPSCYLKNKDVLDEWHKGDHRYETKIRHRKTMNSEMSKSKWHQPSCSHQKFPSTYEIKWNNTLCPLKSTLSPATSNWHKPECLYAISPITEEAKKEVVKNTEINIDKLLEDNIWEDTSYDKKEEVKIPLCEEKVIAVKEKETSVDDWFEEIFGKSIFKENVEGNSSKKDKSDKEKNSEEDSKPTKGILKKKSSYGRHAAQDKPRKLPHAPRSKDIRTTGYSSPVTSTIYREFLGPIRQYIGHIERLDSSLSNSRDEHPLNNTFVTSKEKKCEKELTLPISPIQNIKTECTNVSKTDVEDLTLPCAPKPEELLLPRRPSKDNEEEEPQSDDEINKKNCESQTSDVTVDEITEDRKIERPVNMWDLLQNDDPSIERRIPRYIGTGDFRRKGKHLTPKNYFPPVLDNKPIKPEKTLERSRSSVGQATCSKSKTQTIVRSKSAEPDASKKDSMHKTQTRALKKSSVASHDEKVILCMASPKKEKTSKKKTEKCSSKPPLNKEKVKDPCSLSYSEIHAKKAMMKLPKPEVPKNNQNTCVEPAENVSFTTSSPSLNAWEETEKDLNGIFHNSYTLVEDLTVSTDDDIIKQENRKEKIEKEYDSTKLPGAVMYTRTPIRYVPTSSPEKEQINKIKQLYDTQRTPPKSAVRPIRNQAIVNDIIQQTTNKKCVYASPIQRKNEVERRGRLEDSFDQHEKRLGIVDESGNVRSNEQLMANIDVKHQQEEVEKRLMKIQERKHKRFLNDLKLSRHKRHASCPATFGPREGLQYYGKHMYNDVTGSETGTEYTTDHEEENWTDDRYLSDFDSYDQISGEGTASDSLRDDENENRIDQRYIEASSLDLFKPGESYTFEAFLTENNQDEDRCEKQKAE